MPSDEEREGHEEKPRRRKKEVAIVATSGESVLVEWADGGPKRAYVPREKIEGGQCYEDVLAAGIPYGVPWEELIETAHITPQAIGDALRRYGIWTSADIESRLNAVRRALDAAMKLTGASLHGLARQYETKEV